jgi:hypothetical protein
MAWLTENLASTHPELAKALLLRLELRMRLLTATEAQRLPQDSQFVVDVWEQCKSILPKILETAKLARVVPDSFSAKIQRRLASTVPPRPIVYVSFGDAISHLSQLCDDARVVLQMKTFQGAINKSVSKSLRFNPISDLIDLCLAVHLSKTSTIGLRKSTVTVDTL